MLESESGPFRRWNARRRQRLVVVTVCGSGLALASLPDPKVEGLDVAVGPFNQSAPALPEADPQPEGQRTVRTWSW